MKPYICLFLSVLISWNTIAQHNHMLTNTIPVDSLLSHESFDFSFDGYTVPEDIDAANTALLKEYKIIIFLGTWCSDSQIMLPEIYHYLKSRIPAEDITYYGLDETKLSSNQWEEQYNIEFVPTVIFMDKATGAEKGRIIEYYKEDLYNDIHKILQP